MVPYKKHILQLCQGFTTVTFDHIPRDNNQVVDALATLSSMFTVELNEEIESIKIQKRDIPAYCLHIEEESDEKSWYYDIKRYIQHREYPEEISENDK